MFSEVTKFEKLAEYVSLLILKNIAFSVTIFDFASPRPILYWKSRRPETTLNTTLHHHEKESILDCHIARLEVVRGLERAFEIDDSGFSFISANSTLIVSN